MRQILTRAIRFLFYCAIPVLTVLAVAARQREVTGNRAVTVPTIRGEWDRDGKPVFVRKVMPIDAHEQKRFTVIIDEDASAGGWVTGDINSSLRKGHAVTATYRGNTICGRIENAAVESDPDTGMYAVAVEFDGLPGIPSGTYLPVDVSVRTLENVIALPDVAIDLLPDHAYVWRIENGRAKRIAVTIGPRTDQGVVISEGLNAGDVIVVNGTSLINVDDMVQTGVIQ